MFGSSSKFFPFAKGTDVKLYPALLPILGAQLLSRLLNMCVYNHEPILHYTSDELGTLNYQHSWIPPAVFQKSNNFLFRTSVNNYFSLVILC
jgi:hypothetical protein